MNQPKYLLYRDLNNFLSIWGNYNKKCILHGFVSMLFIIFFSKTSESCAIFNIWSDIPAIARQDPEKPSCSSASALVSDL